MAKDCAFNEPIQHEQARKAIEKAYLLVGLPVPEIVFVDSPRAGFYWGISPEEFDVQT